MRTRERTTRLRNVLSSLALAVPLLLFGAGCATGRADPFRGGPSAKGLDVVVENHAWTDMSVYAASGAERIRLGDVSSGRTASFRVRELSNHTVDVELFADPIASSQVYRTGRLLVLEGQRVTWTIHESTLGGTVTVR